MATTKIWPVRDNLSRVLDYAENHLKTANPYAYTAAELKDLHDVLDYAANGEKTAQKFYVTGVNCIAETAYSQMTATKQRFGKTGGNLAYHAYQSFAPDEVTPEQCHQIGVALAKRLWGDKYEILVSTHLNTHCCHNHFVINSVSLMDGKKLNNNYAMYFDVLRKGSDVICAEHGLSVIENPARTKAPRVLYEAEKNGEPTRYNIMRQDIDRAILHSMSPTTFGMCLKSLGYLVNTDPRHKYWTIAIPGDKQVTRMYRLGESYTNQAIWSRIQRQRPIVPPKRERPKIQHYRLHGSFRDIRRMNGLSALFLAFVLILQKIVNYNRVPNQPQPLRYTPGLRASIRLMERYSEEARLLCRNKIQTPEQLKLFADSRNQRRSELIDERKAVYSKLKSAKIPDAEKATLTARRDKISGEIKVIRRELFLVSDIEKRTDEIRQKLRAQREYQARQLGLDKPQQKLRGVRDYGAR